MAATSFSSAVPARPRAFALALALTGAAALVPAAMAAAPADGRPVAILGSAADAAGRMAAVGDAGGAIVDLLGERVLIAVSDDPDFISKLRHRGYWLVLDARALAGCGAKTNRT